MSTEQMLPVLPDLAAAAQGIPWALIGGQALFAHGVPRGTPNADVLVLPERLEELALRLVRDFAWVPMRFSPATSTYIPGPAVDVHTFDDAVLSDLGQERQFVPLSAPTGLPVRLFAAQHPIEQEMIREAELLPVRDTLRSTIPVPVAPLGGVLLVKVKAHRLLDLGAIEQTAEHLYRTQLDEAVQWAAKRDPAAAQELQQRIAKTLARLVPTRMVPVSKYKRKP